MGLRERLRRDAGSLVAEGFFRGMAGLGQLHPRARPARHGVEVVRDVPYLASGSSDHHLDVYRPVGTAAGARLPALLYVHGGGFRILSKDTHWVMGIALARARFVVFSINYRLAPAHRYPAAIEDACDAYRWVVEHGAEYGGDVSRLVLAGESAGANLVSALAVAACFPRSEPHAKKVFETGVVPKAVMPACGLLQVTDTQRFSRRKAELPRFVADRIEEVTQAYLGRVVESVDSGAFDLADPLVVFESEVEAARAIPPFFVPCGTADPLLDDTRRLGAALRKRGSIVEDRYYPGEVHAFHAFVFRSEAKRCWTDTYRFLDQHVPR